MIYLILAIVSSALIAVLMRILDPYIKNNMVMFTANYAICEVLSLIFLFAEKGAGAFSFGGSSNGLPFAIILGLVSGILYLVSFMLLQLNIQKNGVIMASTFMKLGVVVPVLMAIIFFGESCTIFQIIGFALALAAIIIINGFTKKETSKNKKIHAESLKVQSDSPAKVQKDLPDKIQPDFSEKVQQDFSEKVQQNPSMIIQQNSPEKVQPDFSEEVQPDIPAKGSMLLLLILLFIGGLTDSTSNIFDKLGDPGLKNVFLLFIFLSAIISSLVMAFVKKQHFTLKDFLCGLAIGIPNYFSSRFLLYSLGSIPAVIAYPSYNIAVIFIVSIVGAAAFKEKLNAAKVIGLILIAGAIVTLNL